MYNSTIQALNVVRQVLKEHPTATWQVVEAALKGADSLNRKQKPWGKQAISKLIAQALAEKAGKRAINPVKIVETDAAMLLGYIQTTLTLPNKSDSDKIALIQLALQK